MNIPSWSDILLFILPMPIYEEIRSDIQRIYLVAFLQYAQSEYFSMSPRELRSHAKKYAVGASNYDPNKSISQIQDFMEGFVRIVRNGALVVLAYGIAAEATGIIVFSVDVYSLTDPITLVLHLMGGLPALVVILFILYFEVLSFSGFVVGTIYDELHITYSEIDECSDKSTLIKYMCWNSSLNSDTGIKLLAILSALKTLSIIPRKDPYQYIINQVIQNIDIFTEATGFLDAAKIAAKRIRHN